MRTDGPIRYKIWRETDYACDGHLPWSLVAVYWGDPADENSAETVYEGVSYHATFASAVAAFRAEVAL